MSYMNAGWLRPDGSFLSAPNWNHAEVAEEWFAESLEPVEAAYRAGWIRVYGEREFSYLSAREFTSAQRVFLADEWGVDPDEAQRDARANRLADQPWRSDA